MALIHFGTNQEDDQVLSNNVLNDRVCNDQKFESKDKKENEFTKSKCSKTNDNKLIPSIKNLSNQDLKLRSKNIAKQEDNCEVQSADTNFAGQNKNNQKSTSKFEYDFDVEAEKEDNHEIQLADTDFVVQKENKKNSTGKFENDFNVEHETLLVPNLASNEIKLNKFKKTNENHANLKLQNDAVKKLKSAADNREKVNVKPFTNSYENETNNDDINKSTESIKNKNNDKHNIKYKRKRPDSYVKSGYTLGYKNNSKFEKPNDLDYEAQENTSKKHDFTTMYNTIQLAEYLMELNQEKNNNNMYEETNLCIPKGNCESERFEKEFVTTNLSKDKGSSCFQNQLHKTIDIDLQTQEPSLNDDVNSKENIIVNITKDPKHDITNVKNKEEHKVIKAVYNNERGIKESSSDDPFLNAVVQEDFKSIGFNDQNEIVKTSEMCNNELNDLSKSSQVIIVSTNISKENQTNNSHESNNHEQNIAQNIHTCKESDSDNENNNWETEFQSNVSNQNINNINILSTVQNSCGENPTEEVKVINTEESYDKEYARQNIYKDPNILNESINFQDVYERYENKEKFKGKDDGLSPRNDDTFISSNKYSCYQPIKQFDSYSNASTLELSDEKSINYDDSNNLLSRKFGVFNNVINNNETLVEEAKVQNEVQPQSETIVNINKNDEESKFGCDGKMISEITKPESPIIMEDDFMFVNPKSCSEISENDDNGNKTIENKDSRPESSGQPAKDNIISFEYDGNYINAQETDEENFFVFDNITCE
ncbi:hypothetical protein COBT_000705 [Conglomerata obtusa]